MNRNIIFSLAIAAAGILNADLSSGVGSGNFDTGYGDGMTTANQNKLDALNAYNAGYARFGIYRYDYWRNNAPFFTIDDQLLQAHAQGIKALISFNWKPGSDPIGDYSMWYTIGEAYANRYAPGGTLWQNNNISNFGVTVFAAFNEPDWGDQYHQPYHDALEGLADGIHSIDSSLKVTPAGWHSADATNRSDFTQYGYGTAIVDLFNDGTLDGIDLHIYSTNDGGGGQLPGRRKYESAQKLFDDTKSALGITRDINFYCSEFNVRDRQNYVPSEDEPHLASRLLTAFWDKHGVIGNSGQLVTQFGMVFVLFDDAPNDQFSCAYDLSPLNLKKRGDTIQLATTLAQDMEFTYLDPNNEGLYVLENGVKKMWVWQNVSGWTNCAGTSFTLTGIPSSAEEIHVYGWDGLRDSVPTNGQSTLTINNLEESQTYMFVSDIAEPISAWCFEQNVIDQVGGNDATINGNPFYSTGEKEGGYSIEFDGNGDWLDIRDSSLQSSFTSRTVSFWLKTDNYNTTQPQVIYEEGGIGQGFAIRVINSEIQVAVRQGGTQYTLTTTWNVNYWKRITVVFDGSDNGSLKIYKNDHKDGTYFTGLSSIGNHTNPAGIGARNDDDAFGDTSTGGYFDGKLDDFRIYDQALTEEEAGYLANYQLPLF